MGFHIYLLDWRARFACADRLTMLSLYWQAIQENGLRRVLERLRRLGLVLTSQYGCEACSSKWPHMFPFMVHDDLWEEVTGDSETELCLACFEAKMMRVIGRGLLPMDFTDCSMNEPVLYLLAIGRRGFRCGGGEA